MPLNRVRNTHLLNLSNWVIYCDKNSFDVIIRARCIKNNYYSTCYLSHAHCDL